MRVGSHVMQLANDVSTSTVKICTVMLNVVICLRVGSHMWVFARFRDCLQSKL